LHGQVIPLLNNKKNSPIYYGYVVLAACFFIMTFVYGAQYSFGVFFKPMLNEFGWTRASTSGPFSLSMILGGLLSIISGRLSDRFGPRIVVTVGGIILGSGYLLMSRISNLWQLYLFYGIIVAVGSSAMYAPLVAMLARWFFKRRGLMAGIGISGIGFGIGVVPMIANQLIISFNWRTSLLIVGAASLVLIVLLAQLLRAEPETNLLDDNKDKEAETPIHAKGLSFRESAKTRQFWMIFIAWILYGFFFQVGVVHIVPYATDLGMSVLAAATILMIIGLIGTLSRICLGFAGDRFNNKTTLLISFILLAVAFIGVSASGTVRMLYVFAVLYGTFSGVGILLAPITAEYFGLKATLAGYIFDTTGSYQLAFISCGILGIAASIIIWLLKPVREHPSTGTANSRLA
jgi:MFS family permease